MSSASPSPYRFSWDRGHRNQSTGTCAAPYRREVAPESNQPRNWGKSVAWLGPWLGFCRRVHRPSNRISSYRPRGVLSVEHPESPFSASSTRRILKCDRHPAIGPWMRSSGGLTTSALEGRTDIPFLVKLPALLAEQYPTIQSLVLARRGCVEFEYYKAGLDARSLSPVHSITKSVLSVLVGIALDRGHLRLDQKLSELWSAP